jgi:predicted permease
MDNLFVILVFALGLGLQPLLKRFSSLKIKEALNKYLIYAGLPLLVFLSVRGVPVNSLGEYAIFSFIIAMAIVIVMYFIIKRLHIPSEDKAALFLSSAFGNTAYFGIPISFLLFGDTGASIAGMFTFVLLCIHLSLGLILAKKYTHSKKTIRTVLNAPLFWLLIAAFILAEIPFSIMPQAGELLTVLKSVTSYLAVFIIGASLQLTAISLKTVKQSMLKLVIAPLIAIVFLVILRPIHWQTYLLLAALPSAFLNTSLALEFKFNEKLTSALTLVGSIVFLAAYLLISIIY